MVKDGAHPKEEENERGKGTAITVGKKEQAPRRKGIKEQVVEEQ